MTCSLAPFGGGSRVVSLWDMLRFYADKFVDVLNTLKLVEGMLARPESVLEDESTLSFIGNETQRLYEQLLELDLRLSAKVASRLQFGITDVSRKDPVVWAAFFKKYSEELRARIADELEGRVLYYVPGHTDLLSDNPLFGNGVDDAFPSAQFDISESGRCLAFGRSTACVLHLMRALEVALASLASELGLNLTTENWNTILKDIEDEIRSRTKASHGQAWKDVDEPFFTEAATHFRFIKNGWRNHAMHNKDKYTDEEAAAIFDSVRSFMRHLSERLSEEGQSS